VTENRVVFDESFASACAACDAGDLAVARDVLRRLAADARTPNDRHAVHLVLGRVESLDGHARRAVVALRRAVASGPRSPRASIALFQTLWALHERDAALREMRRFLRCGGDVRQAGHQATLEQIVALGLASPTSLRLRRSRSAAADRALSRLPATGRRRRAR
jgi:predicted Zn-dependent protease